MVKVLEYVLVKVLDIFFWFVDFFAEIFQNRPKQKVAYTIGYFVFNYLIFTYTISSFLCWCTLFFPLLGFLWVYRD